MFSGIMKPCAPVFDKTVLHKTVTTTRHFRIERKAICFFRFILEGYDGIATLETIDPGAGRIAIHIAPGCEEMVEGIVADLAKEHLVERY